MSICSRRHHYAEPQTFQAYTSVHNNMTLPLLIHIIIQLSSCKHNDINFNTRHMHEGHSTDIRCVYLSVLAAVYVCCLYVENIVLFICL